MKSPFSGVLFRQVLAPGDKAPSGALLGLVAATVPSPEQVDAFLSQYGEHAKDFKGEDPEERLVATASGKVRVVSAKWSSPAALAHSWLRCGRDELVRERLGPGRLSARARQASGHGASFKTLGPEPLDTLIGAMLEVTSQLDERPCIWWAIR